MDHFSFLIDPQHRFLLIGIILLVMTAVFTLSGETLERYNGSVYRTEEPNVFGGMLSYIFSRVFSLLASTCTRIRTETLPSSAMP
jgi:predicted cation transporter